MAGVEPALLAQQFQRLEVQALALALTDRWAVPAETEPAEIRLDRLFGAAAVTGCVEIVEAEQPLALAEPGLQPAQQGGAQISRMQQPGGGWGESAATLATAQPLTLLQGLKQGAGELGRRRDQP